jgi:hypothetical protein
MQALGSGGDSAGGHRDVRRQATRAGFGMRRSSPRRLWCGRIWLDTELGDFISIILEIEMKRGNRVLTPGSK